MQNSIWVFAAVLVASSQTSWAADMDYRANVGTRAAGDIATVGSASGKYNDGQRSYGMFAASGDSVELQSARVPAVKVNSASQFTINSASSGGNSPVSVGGSASPRVITTGCSATGYSCSYTSGLVNMPTTDGTNASCYPYYSGCTTGVFGKQTVTGSGNPTSGGWTFNSVGPNCLQSGSTSVNSGSSYWVRFESWTKKDATVPGVCGSAVTTITADLNDDPVEGCYATGSYPSVTCTSRSYDARSGETRILAINRLSLADQQKMLARFGAAGPSDEDKAKIEASIRAGHGLPF